MTCKELEPRIAGLIDGSLAEGERERVETHLQSCEDCRRALAELKASNALVKRLGEVEPPPWLKTRVMARVREESQGRGSVFRKLFFPLHIKVPIQALATVLVAVVAWNVYKTGEPEFRQTAPPSTSVQEAPQVQAPPEPGPAPGPAKGDERPASREKKAFAPPPAPRQEPAPQRAATVREESTADAGKPAEPLRAAKRAAGPLKDETAAGGTSAVRQGEADRVLEAGDQKQKAVKAPVGAVANEAGKQEARPPASPMMSAAVSARPDLDITLRAQDPLSAASGIEELLRNIGAQSIERKTRDGRVTLTTRIRPEDLEALREKLTSLGTVREIFQVSPRPGAPLVIRLEIRSE